MDSMMTLFRCFTDGCTAYDGTPLQVPGLKKRNTVYGSKVFGSVQMLVAFYNAAMYLIYDTLQIVVSNLIYTCI